MSMIALLLVAMIPAAISHRYNRKLLVLPKGFAGDWLGVLALYFCFIGNLVLWAVLAIFFSNDPINNLGILIFAYAFSAPILSLCAKHNSAAGKFSYIGITLLLWFLIFILLPMKTGGLEDFYRF